MKRVSWRICGSSSESAREQFGRILATFGVQLVRPELDVCTRRCSSEVQLRPSVLRGILVVDRAMTRLAGNARWHVVGASHDRLLLGTSTADRLRAVAYHSLNTLSGAGAGSGM